MYLFIFVYFFFFLFNYNGKCVVTFQLMYGDRHQIEKKKKEGAWS